MENSIRRKVVAVALIGIVLISLAVVGFALALSSNGAKRGPSGVFAKVYGWGDWIELTTGYQQALLNITLPNIPVGAYYYVVCDGYANIRPDCMVDIAIGVDSATEDETTRRMYKGIYEANLLGGIHTERVYYLGPGSHTFYFLALKHGEGRAAVNYQTITVIVFTGGSLTELESKYP